MSNVEDGLLHIGMGVAMAIPVVAPAYGLGLEGYAVISLWGLTGAYIVYIREVVQAQMKRKIETGQPYRFFSDWNPFKFSPGKQVETWIAVVPLMVASIIAGVFTCQP